MHDDERVSYSHGGLGTPTAAYSIEDIFQEMSIYETNVNGFLGRVFRALNETLEDKETEQLCGIFHHRAYQRFVSPGEARDFNSGRCKSYEWFEKEEQPTCPLSDQCGAYVRALEMRAQGGQ